MATYKPKKRLTPGEEAEIASAQWDRYTRARDNGHIEYIENAKRCDAFYRGDQWDENDLAQLEAEGRPALTINTVLPTINTVLGEQSKQKTAVQTTARWRY